MSTKSRFWRGRAMAGLWGGACLGALAVTGLARGPVPTTLEDFFGPGTQPNMLIDPFESAGRCESCHGGYDPELEPFRPWAASMMGQAARDPLFLAALAIAEQDASFAGDLCLRCHTPGGWLEGRSVPTSGAGLIAKDLEGVNCISCHRMVDPDYKPGVSPSVDLDIITALQHPPVNPHSGHGVFDPLDRRRGPYDLGGFNRHDWLQSPFHRDANMCITCHDVSNPVYERQPNGTYALGTLGQPHPTHDKYDQFPIERTGSEWLMSDFAKGPINMGGRFGGNRTEVSTCQDCHMPATTGKGAKQGETRTDLGQHHFAGGNTWVLQAIRNLYPDKDTFLDSSSVAASIARTVDLLQRAADLELAAGPSTLSVRVVNQTGHKLPTGYPEGRRMWINVRFLDAGGFLVAEHGAYDLATATLSVHDTKVYEAKLGVDEAASQLTGIPVGPSFHFAVNNMWYKDNRIPPRGFTNEGFASVQAAPVGYTYEDGQYWDDTEYPIPAGAASAQVRLFFQTASREYIEFLRDENRTNQAGQVLYDQWVATGRSEPSLMASAQTPVQPCYADCNGDGRLDFFDFLCFQNAFLAGDPYADCNNDGRLDFFDFLCFQNAFLAGCP